MNLTTCLSNVASSLEGRAPLQNELMIPLIPWAEHRGFSTTHTRYGWAWATPSSATFLQAALELAAKLEINVWLVSPSNHSSDSLLKCICVYTYFDISFKWYQWINGKETTFLLKLPYQQKTSSPQIFHLHVPRLWPTIFRAATVMRWCLGSFSWLQKKVVVLYFCYQGFDFKKKIETSLL